MLICNILLLFMSCRYGHISPKTDWGKIVLMIYSTLGIPLMLVFLANIGNVVAAAYKKTYQTVCCVECCLKSERQKQKEKEKEEKERLKEAKGFHFYFKYIKR